MASYYTNRPQSGYDSGSEASHAPWESFVDDMVPSLDYHHSMSPASATSTGAPNTPAMHNARPSTSRTSSSSSIKKSPTYSTSVPETEEERRKNRKREQNRESQRAFRRRQENRVKFLESKTLELETCSRQLRAENEQLRVALLDARSRNDELVTTISVMHLTPSPLNIASDVTPSIEDGGQYYGQEMDPRVVW